MMPLVPGLFRVAKQVRFFSLGVAALLGSTAKPGLSAEAVAPTIENEPGQRIVPPVSVTFAFGWLESSIPMFTAFVTMWMPSR